MFEIPPTKKRGTGWKQWRTIWSYMKKITSFEKKSLFIFKDESIFGPAGPQCFFISSIITIPKKVTYEMQDYFLNFSCVAHTQIS